jgi:hypothetical protein
MAPGEEADEGLVDGIALADDHLLDLLRHSLSK